MSGRSPEGTIWKEANGRYRGGVQVNGVPYGPRGRTRKEVRQKLDDFINKPQKFKTSVEKGTTVATLCDQWLVVCRHRVDTGTLAVRSFEAYSRNVRLYIKPVLGNVLVVNVTQAHVMQLQSHVLGLGLARNTAAQVHRALGTAVQTAVADGAIGSNPVRTVPAPCKDKTDREAGLTVAQSQAMADKSDRRDLGMNPCRVSCASFLGLRQSETLGLWTNDVNLDSGLIYVTRNRSRLIWLHGALCLNPDDHSESKCPDRWCGPDAGTTKTPAGVRTIPIPPHLLDVFREHLAVVSSARRVLGDRWEDPTPWLFPRRFGGAPSVSSDTHRWRRLVRKALGKEVPTGTHAARRCAATRLAEAGVSIETAKKLLGWSSGELMAIYERISTKHIKEEMARAWDLLKPEN